MSTQFVAWMSLRGLTDVLTALLFYDFLLYFMLTACDGCIESDIKSLSRWRREAYRKIIRPGLKSRKGINYFRRSKKILSSFLGSTSKLKSSSRQRTVRSENTKDKAGTQSSRQCIQMQILMPLQRSSFQLTKLNKRPLPPLKCALLFPMCPC